MAPPALGRKPIQIERTKLLLVEGADAYYFCIWAYQAFGAGEIQVIDFGGNEELRLRLRSVSLLPKFEEVKTIVIARDAETNPFAAISSVQSAMQDVSLSVPNRPFEFAGTSPRTAFMLFPGLMLDTNGKELLMHGTLEDLCFSTIKDRPIIECVDRFVECAESKGQEIRRPHKSKLHAYLASQWQLVGLKLGEASKAGAWDWNHDAFEPFRRVILSM